MPNTKIRLKQVTRKKLTPPNIKILTVTYYLVK